MPRKHHLPEEVIKLLSLVEDVAVYNQFPQCEQRQQRRGQPSRLNIQARTGYC